MSWIVPGWSAAVPELTALTLAAEVDSWHRFPAAETY
jgi:hypothetical protein